MKKLIINLAPTGMVPTKEMTPFVPVNPLEIVKDVLTCADQGVSIVHLHVRENGVPTYKKEIYAEIIAGIREKRPDLIIATSTSGRNFKEFEKRADVLSLTGNLKPDMASLTLSSLNFIKSASVNSPDNIMKLLKTMKDKNIKPELEVFDLGMVNYAKYLIKKGYLKAPYYFNIILGNIASAQAKLLHAGLIIAELPEDSYYTLTGIGDYQKEMNALGVILADGVRVGLEDNIWHDYRREKLTTNLELVKGINELAKAYDREIASPRDVRKMLNLNGD